MFMMIGPKMLPKRLARSTSCWRLSLRRSKSASVACSWQKTLTTFWPWISSSTKPSTAPRERCCWMKLLAERPPTVRVTWIMATTPRSTTSIRGMLK